MMSDFSAQVTALQDRIGQAIRGSARFDRLARTLYSVDASVYEIAPFGVVWPRDADDVVATVNLCREHGVPVIPRGGGTGLAGSAIGRGVVIDCSRYMRQADPPDLDAQTIRVEPGVVLSELNAALSAYGLQFAPDVATANRATIGGMIANNSCGAHSVLYGRTVDHVESMRVVLADGSLAEWPANGASVSARAAHIEKELRRIAADYREEIAARFPKVLRRNGGYALDLLASSDGSVDPGKVVCGSEGTLCFVTEAVLKLTSLPKNKALVVAHFSHVLDALGAAPVMLEHKPAAVELLDRMITEAAEADPVSRHASTVVDMKASAMLLVEFFGDTAQEAADRAETLRDDLKRRDVGSDVRAITEPERQRVVWRMRERGLGLLMSRPGDAQPHAFVEDSAVDPRHLRDYIERFGAILEEEEVYSTGYYAHASVGVIHVRPVLNLKKAEDVAKMARIADRVSSLALEYGGAMTGEHGDGIVRSGWHEKMYGAELVRAFHEVKQAFDPEGVFNPGKIVDPLPMTENLRYGPQYRAQQVKTYLDFSVHGGMAGLAEMCSGVGECRKRRVETMCPSYMATGEERDTTRARANALRAALSEPGLLAGLDDPALDEVMDLCISCKACKSECPTGVDMARLKAEWLSHRNMRHGVPRGSRFTAEAPRWARLGGRFPRLSNWMLQSGPMRAIVERRYGLDRRIPPPRFAARTFRQWYRQHRKRVANEHADRPPVVYFADTWTNYYTPNVGIAAVKVLEAAGFQVLSPSFECCGRPLISKGMLAEAKHLAELNVDAMVRFAERGTPIIGTEPSCILTLVDEYPQLVRTLQAKLVGDVAVTFESFVARLLRQSPDRIPFAETARCILYHGHCHQKAIVGTGDAMTILSHPPGYRTQEIESGCCGMAGAFGHEKHHYEVAKAIGEERLFPAIRERGEAMIAVSGFSCRHQVEHHTAVQALHPAELLASAIRT